MLSSTYWRLAVYADPATDKPTLSAEFGETSRLRQELIFVYGLDRSYVEHGLMIAASNETKTPRNVAGFEFCKSREEKGGERIVWVGQVTLVRR